MWGCPSDSVPRLAAPDSHAGLPNSAAGATGIGSRQSHVPARDKRYNDYFCATNSLARLSSGRVEFDPSQTFSSSA
jgi:hypothetical protein